MSGMSATDSTTGSGTGSTAASASLPEAADAERSAIQAVAGTLRDCTANGRGRRRIEAGDIAVINEDDLSRREAQVLLDARPVAVVNIGQFTTGSVPNFGPLMLLDAGITLVEDAGEGILSGFRDGAKKGRIRSDGTVLNGTKEIAKASPLTQEDADARFEDARGTLGDTMTAFSGNTVEFVQYEAPLLIDGMGIPDVGPDLTGRKVLVLADAPDSREQLRNLRNFIREYEPVLIGVETGADTLATAGYRPDFIVGDPAQVGNETLRGGARVILPADPDGHATGLERIQDLGVGAMTFPAATDSATDLALLLAEHHGASLIVLAGETIELDDVLVRAPQATPATVLTRLKLGGRLVSADAIISLYSLGSGRGLAWLWALLGILVALAAIILVVGLGGDADFATNLVDTWNGIVSSVQGWFS